MSSRCRSMAINVNGFQGGLQYYLNYHCKRHDFSQLDGLYAEEENGHFISILHKQIPIEIIMSTGG